MQTVSGPAQEAPVAEPASTRGGRLPAPLTNGHARPVPRARRTAALQLLRHMLTARWVDRVEMELVNRGEGFFHVGGAGHEGTAGLAPHLTAGDWLHLHYRDKALMLARGLPVRQFFDSLVCNATSHSAGRQMSAHLSAPELHLLSLVGPVGNNALQAVGVAHQIRTQPKEGMDSSPIVVCALGDGTTQQGEVLEAIAEAVRASCSSSRTTDSPSRRARRKAPSTNVPKVRQRNSTESPSGASMAAMRWSVMTLLGGWWPICAGATDRPSSSSKSNA
jgi:hypothetical protein